MTKRHAHVFVSEHFTKVGPMEETCTIDKTSRSEAVRAAAECLIIDGSSNIGFSFGVYFPLTEGPLSMSTLSKHFIGICFLPSPTDELSSSLPGLVMIIHCDYPVACLYTTCCSNLLVVEHHWIVSDWYL